MASTRRIRVLALVAAAGLFVTACGGSSDSADTTSPTSDPIAVDTAPDAGPSTSDAPEILQFTSPLVGGGELDAASLAGKPTAFWFWAPT
ncbi:hypothetical protein [Ilumatobacter sp.]|uniref:hypothetical protein n=1 Tax=Ilumatobacter sp. TaxID=1967498 RepID=UPI003C350BF4